MQNQDYLFNLINSNYNFLKLIILIRKMNTAIRVFNFSSIEECLIYCPAAGIKFCGNGKMWSVWVGFQKFFNIYIFFFWWVSSFLFYFFQYKFVVHFGNAKSYTILLIVIKRGEGIDGLSAWSYPFSFYIANWNLFLSLTFKCFLEKIHTQKKKKQFKN